MTKQACDFFISNKCETHPMYFAKVCALGLSNLHLRTFEMEERRAVLNLLAVIHGDGGQHTGKVGLIQSCKDAEKVRYDLINQIDQLNFDLAGEDL